MWFLDKGAVCQFDREDLWPSLLFYLAFAFNIPPAVSNAECLDDICEIIERVKHHCEAPTKGFLSVLLLSRRLSACDFYPPLRES